MDSYFPPAKVEQALERLLASLDQWIELQREKRKRPVPKGTISAALLVLEELKDAPELEFDDLLSKDHGQLRGCSGHRVHEIIAKFGYHNRPMTVEGGRSNRGQLVAARELFSVLDNEDSAALRGKDRSYAFEHLQRRVYEELVKPWYQTRAVEIKVTEHTAASQVIERLMHATRTHTGRAAVLEHAVGAAFAVAHPSVKHQIHATSASDQATGLEGDFEYGTLAFHVTLAANQGHVDKCLRNRDNGFEPIIVTPRDAIGAARLLVEAQGAEEVVEILGVEDHVAACVSTAVLEGHCADRPQAVLQFLIEYNRRIEEAESDHSLKVVVPKSLAKHAKRG